MASILGDMEAHAPKPTVKSRKRKPELEPRYDYGGSSPPSAMSYRRNDGYGGTDPDLSSDGPFDDGVEFSSGGEEFMSPKKKLKTEDTPGLVPAIEGMGKLGVESGTDGELSGLDMDAFMDVDEDGAYTRPD